MILFYNKIKNKSLKECIKNSIRDIWTHTSTALEGNTISLDDTSFLLNEGITIGGKTLLEHNEIIGHSKAIDLLYSIIEQDTQFSQKELFELHKCVMINPPVDIYAPVGKYKVEENYTTVIDEDGKMEIVEYPSFRKTNSLMEKWFKLFEKIKEEPLEMQYSILHCAFTKIHPFADGNGRMARLLATLLGAVVLRFVAGMIRRIRSATWAFGFF